MVVVGVIGVSGGAVHRLGGVVVGVLAALEPPHGPRPAQPQREHDREGQPVVAVELQFGQQVARRDADEGARAEREGERQDLGATLGDAEPHHRGSDRHDQGEEEVHEVGEAGRTPRRAHERRDRQAVERLVQQDHEESRQARDHAAMVVRRRREHGCAERDALEDAVQREADRRADPSKLALLALAARRVGVRMRALRVPVAVASIVAAVVVAGLLGGLVLMEVEEPLEQEHRHEAEDEREHDTVERSVQEPVRQPAPSGGGRCLERDDHGVGEKVEESDAKHRAADEAECELQLAVRQLEAGRQGAAGKRCESDEEAVDDDQPARRNRAGGGGVVSDKDWDGH